MRRFMRTVVIHTYKSCLSFFLSICQSVCLPVILSVG